jgi:uncharacterized membrane protein required for colicin V production
MWFSLFVTVLILAVTFYQGLQGLFSAIINCVLTILAAALAFGLYEDLYVWQLATYQPDHGRAIALVGVFVIALLVMRTVMDQLITGNLHFPMYTDRIGGGIFGLVTAMIIIGILAIGFQMLPFESTFLGFSRFSIIDQAKNKEIVNGPRINVHSKGADEEVKNAVYRDEVDWNNVKITHNNLWLNPDGFTVSLVSLLSSFALQGRNSFADLNPDFLDYVHHVKDGLGRESLETITPGTVRVKEYRFLRDNEPVYKSVRAKDEMANPIVKFELTDRKPAPGKRWMRVTVDINEKADKAQDKANLNFTSSQIRLLARDRKDGPVVAYPLIGINEDDAENAHRTVEVHPCQDIQFKRGEGGNTQMKLLFEVPDSPAFQPWMIQYKYNARGEILSTQYQPEDKPGSAPGGKKPKDKQPPKPAPAPPKTGQEPPDASPEPPKTETTPPPTDGSASTTPPAPSDDRSGRVQGIRSRAQSSYFGPELPFELTNYSIIGDLEVANEVIKGGTGQLLAPMNEKEHVPVAGNKPPIKGFFVPEGKRLLHLSCEKLDPQSLWGKAIGNTVDKTQWPQVVDAAGGRYMAIGVYAIAMVGRQNTLEIIYYSEQAQATSVPPHLQKIKLNDFREDNHYELYYVFAVTPGAKIVRLEASSRYHENLDDRNLVAPK